MNLKKMKLIFEHDNAQLWYDDEFRILKAIWFGEVGIDAFQGLVMKGSEVLNNIDAVHLIFDRRKLDNFSADARIWFKHDFMQKDGEGRRLIKRVRKMAAIKGKSVMGQIASTVVAKVLLVFNPQLDYKIFESERIAEGWTKSLPLLRHMNTPQVETTQRRSFFRLLFG